MTLRRKSMLSTGLATASMPSRLLRATLGGSVLAFTVAVWGSGTAASTPSTPALPESQPSAPAPQKSKPARRSGSALVGINVSFKLDPRLTQGLYMGDRWVAPPTYTRVGEGKTVTVDARASGLAANGKAMNIQPQWIVTDPDMVAVSPVQGDAVKITVQRSGQSSLRVTAHGVSRELAIKAKYQDRAIVVEIAQ